MKKERCRDCAYYDSVDSRQCTAPWPSWMDELMNDIAINGTPTGVDADSTVDQETRRRCPVFVLSDEARCETCHGNGVVWTGVPDWPKDSTACWSCRGTGRKKQT